MGDPLCAIAVTEPDTGSDVAAVRLKASKCEGGWILDGVKTWCTMAGKAGVLLVLARSNPDRSLGHRGLSMFLVEKDSYEGHDFEYRQPQGGVLSGRAIATIGYRGMHSYEVFFDHVFVPDENLVGGPEARARASTSPWPALPAAAFRPRRGPLASCRPRSRRRFPTPRSARPSASRSATTS
jgi:alkylation response protein AidB-like acyl-CoA dehydrogenase